MLTWVGRSYGVANAHPIVLAAVGHHTASNDDDGVAQILERLFP
jgi:hydroxymethylpyrimidine pyrophosphatase-like HAD family hydrolase